MKNKSVMTEFILLGFSIPQWSRIPFSLLLILLYVFFMCGNILIIVLVKTDSKLHSPMYFFIANFSFLEVWFTTVTMPRMIRDLLVVNTSISFISCIVQFYCFFVCGSNEHCLLAVLSYDRFLAVCRPLSYNMMMNPKFCVGIICNAWFVSFVYPASSAFYLFKTKYCDVHIDHFFCDISPMLQISCSENTKLEQVFYMMATIIILVCFSMICVSYSFILYTVLRIKSHNSRYQAFSTAASHLTVVTIFYSSCMFMYIRLSSYKFFQVDKIVALAYIIVAPLLNPMVYAFRNKAMKAAIRKKIEKLTACHLACN